MGGEGAGRAVQNPPHPCGVGEGPGKLNGIIYWNHFYTFSLESWDKIYPGASWDIIGNNFLKCNKSSRGSWQTWAKYLLYNVQHKVDNIVTRGTAEGGFVSPLQTYRLCGCLCDTAFKKEPGLSWPLNVCRSLLPLLLLTVACQSLWCHELSFSHLQPLQLRIPYCSRLPQWELLNSDFKLLWRLLSQSLLMSTRGKNH